MPLKSTRQKRQTISYLSLEERNLLAGDVTVFEDLHLFLRGDQSDNQVEVVVDGDQLKVIGLNGTTINQQDSYVVRGATVTEGGVSFAGGFRGNLGSGHDALEIKDALFESKSVIFGGTGDDTIDLVDSQFLERVLIQTYSGNDAVSTSGSEFEGDFYTFTLEGRDSVNSTDTVFKSDSIVVTGEHSDSVHSRNSHYLGDANLILSLNGNDEVQLIDPVVGTDELGVYLGNDDDTVGVDLEDATVDSNIKISGQQGVDQPSMMSLNDEIADKTTMVGIEKGVAIFESGGIENVLSGFISYTWSATQPETPDSVFSYTDQFGTAVSLDTTQSINQIEWSGFYSRDYVDANLPELDDNFIIEIFEGTGDPSTVTNAARIEVGSANRVAKGELDLYGETVPLYEYYADVEYTMEAGKQYWVSIYTDLEFEQADEGNTWNWGYGNGETLNSTLLHEARAFGLSSWSNQGQGVVPLNGTEMDLRLRS